MTGQYVQKVWGQEFVIVNRLDYCGKILYLSPGFQCSVHRHRVKHETFYLYEGRMRLELNGETLDLEQGQSVEVPPLTWHRFTNYGPLTAVFIEFSTFHSDDDVERLEPSRRIS